ncbi:MAG: kynureninase [Steroidobacteraceae bacterium]
MSADTALQEARALDEGDVLATFRGQFALPRNERGAPLIYLCGHSLGLAPLAARERVNEELSDWEQLGVNGHHRSRRPWIDYAEQLQEPLARLVGAQRDEVVAMNGLTVNLHLLLASFYRPTPARSRVLIEAGAFPSDRHAMVSQLHWHGLDPAATLIELAPRPGEDTLRHEDIEAQIETEAGHLALVLWPGVQYRTGQAFDLARIARATQRAGAVCGFDLAHAIGNVPLALDESGADFAAWCSYKYLNGGPGAIAGAFVHQRHARRMDLTRLSGWWGHEHATRFAMGPEHVATPGAAAWQLSNPPILATAPLLASLELFDQAGMAALRDKSQRLTSWLETLIARYCADQIAVITPPDPAQRGCQLSLRVRGAAQRARRVFEALQARDVVADWREPDIIRMAPVPLYNRYEDVWQAVTRLAEALQST